MNVGILPMLIVPLSFLFVLLIILIAKAPKVGAWVVGGVVLLAPILFLRLGMAGALAHGEALPLFIVPGTFLFVLMIILLAKAPRAAAGVIVAVLVAILASLLFLAPTYREVVQGEVREIPLASGGHAPHGSVIEVIDGPGGGVRIGQPVLPGNGQGSVDWQPVNRQPAVAAPIWSEGVENEYEADIYPSKLAAVRALGQRMRKPIEQVIADMNTATKIVLFLAESDGALAGPFKQAIAETLPEVPCSVLFGSRNIDFNEIGITLRSDHGVDLGQSPDQQVKATVLANARHRDWEATVRQSYIDKPWMEDFSSFASSNPLQQFIVSRSWETCTSPVEARNQALQDAAAKLQQRIGKKWIIPGVEEALTVGSREVEDGGLVVDLFLQSFDGVSGRFWRHAMLIDASPEKLAWLDARMSRMAQSTRMSWARMILSAVGVLVVIVASYLFLNMATRGYYIWSLRIAGTVLAIAGIVSIILVLR